MNMKPCNDAFNKVAETEVAVAPIEKKYKQQQQQSTCLHQTQKDAQARSQQPQM